MLRLLTLMIISISVIACSKTREEVHSSQIMGNWYFIDTMPDYAFPYHELYIDSSAVHFRLGGFSNPPSVEYTINADTLFFTDSEKSWPIGVFKKVKPDTLVVVLSDSIDKPKGTLTMIRIAKGEQLIPNYDAPEWKANPDSLLEVTMKSWFRRYNEYQVRSGLTTWEEIKKLDKEPGIE